MKTYFEPEMNISVFNTENVITTSNTAMNSLGKTDYFATSSYDALKNNITPNEINAGTRF